jgi:erythromycin esterase
VEVQVSVHIGAGDGQVSLWIRADGPDGRNEGFIETRLQESADSTQWTTLRARLHVTHKTQALTVGFLVVGRRTVWFDDLRILVNGSDYDTVLAAEVQHAVPERKLRQYATSMGTSNPLIPLSDTAALARVIDGARVVALGEATHGTHEFFAMKDRVIRSLFERNGFTAVLMECSMQQARRVNAYILTGAGDPRKLVANLGFWSWDTGEVVELIRWLRLYKLQGHEVEFWGFDTQSPEGAMDSVIAFSQSTNPAIADRIARRYAAIRPILQRLPATGGGTDSASSQFWVSASRDGLALLDQQVGSDVNVGSRERWARLYANIVVQSGLQSLAASTRNGLVRDSIMAANIEWIIAQLPSTAHAVVWAHNGHVERSQASMGWHLNQKFGDKYRVIGMTSYEGSYLAAGPNGFRAYSEGVAPVGSIESALHRLGVPILLLNVRSLRADPAMIWFAEPHEFLAVGAIAEEPSFSPVTLATAFDGLIYFAHTSPSATALSLLLPATVATHGFIRWSYVPLLVIIVAVSALTGLYVKKRAK